MKNLDVRGTTIIANSSTASADAAVIAGAADENQRERLFGRRHNGLRRRRRFQRGRESTAPRRGSVAAGCGRAGLLQRDLPNVPAAAAEGARKAGEKGDPYLEGERIHVASLLPPFILFHFCKRKSITRTFTRI